MCVFDRSAFGLIKVYNCLPQAAVDKSTVKEFQRFLSNFVTELAIAGHPRWELMFTPRLPVTGHPLLKAGC